MAVTNQERVGKAMDLLRAGLAPFVDREKSSPRSKAAACKMDAVRRFADDPILGQKSITQWDVAGLLKLMWETWNDVFGRTLGRADRSLVQELRDWRNKWAHQEPFSSDDADRALDSMNRLLAAVSAPQADEIAKMKMELRRLDLRRAGARREAQGRRFADRAGGGGQSETLARSGDASRRRRQWPLPTGGVRRRSVAGPSWRRQRRIPQADRVLPPYLPDREPQAIARRWRATSLRPGR